MKKSFGSSKSNRPISKPSFSSSKGFSKNSGGMKKPFFQSSKGSFGNKESFKGTPDSLKEGSSMFPEKRRSNRAVSLITLLVLFVCCLVVLCIGGVYLISQGLISIPSFG